jgi:hypothetical protein
MDILQTLKAIKLDRFDLADYLIHFTRQSEKSSFEVLKEIVTSGRINCSWSVRNSKRTIFGSKPAICFTDMPLYSFHRYVLNRNDTTKVDFYGIAIHKTKMFQLGARNVIYGTTTENETESKDHNNDEWTNPNLPASEQYRYMLTNINDINDWTHEREWRWTNHFNKSKGDYLPVWINDEYDKDFGDINFYQEKGIFIIVRCESEIDELETIFKGFRDETIYNKQNMTRTFAVSLENLRSNNRLSYDKLDFITLIKDGICRRMPSS